MAVLRVNSQADRLPDSGTKLHVSVRVTAAVDKIDATPLPASSADEVRPWKWQSDSGEWTPHTAKAWRVWRIDNAGAIKEITAGITSIVVAPADLSPASPRSRVMAVAAVIVLLVVLRMRRPSKDDRALTPILKAINDADIPDAAKDVLRDSVGQVRSAVASLRSMATELAHHS